MVDIWEAANYNKEQGDKEKHMIEMYADFAIKESIRKLNPFVNTVSKNKTKETRDLVWQLRDICNRMLMKIDKNGVYRND